MKELVKHRKTNRKYYVLGTHYDGYRGLLYRLIEENFQEGDRKKYFYGKQTDYVRVPRRR